MLKIKKLAADKKRIGLIISITLILVGVIPLIIFTFYADPNHPYKIEQKTLVSEDGTKIDALIYKPKQISHEGIVVGHGYGGNKQYMQHLCIELVKRGFTVVNIDFRGHGSSEGYVLPSSHEHRYHGLSLDIEAAIDYLEDLDDIEKFGLVGHSMGAHTSVIVAEEHPDKIEATVSIGHIPSDDFDFDKISNLLVGIGEYEQSYSQEKALEFLEEYTGKEDVKVGELYGDFDDGDACKVVIGEGSEHFGVVHNPTIITEMVQWFELAFNGEKADNIELTSHYTRIFYYIALIGVISLVSVILVYLSNWIFKKKFVYPEKDIIKDISIKELGIYYIISVGIGVIIVVPLSVVFKSAIPISQGNFLFALQVGIAIGIMAVYYIILRTTERLGIKDIPLKFKEMCTTNYKHSLIFGLLAALLYIALIAAITHWSNTVSIPTIRETIIILYLTVLFFPFLLIKEFYFRIIQGRLNESNRLREYFKMTGIGILIENLLWITILLILWRSTLRFGTHSVGLAMTGLIVISIIQQTVVTWVYMHSGRNILGSSLFLSIFYAWMIINFFPFGYN